MSAAVSNAKAQLQQLSTDTRKNRGGWENYKYKFKLITIRIRIIGILYKFGDRGGGGGVGPDSIAGSWWVSLGSGRFLGGGLTGYLYLTLTYNQSSQIREHGVAQALAASTAADGIEATGDSTMNGLFVAVGTLCSQTMHSLTTIFLPRK